MTAGRLAIAARVTVRTTPDDPVHIVCHPHVLIVAVREDDSAPSGVVYMVGSSDLSAGPYGPFSRSKLIEGWAHP